MRALTIPKTARTAAAASLAILGLATALVATPAEARRHRRQYRVLLVQGSGLIPGTYPADYGTPGYGCRTSILVGGNFGGCGYGWAYEGGPGWGYR